MLLFEDSAEGGKVIVSRGLRFGVAVHPQNPLHCGDEGATSVP